MKQGLLSVGEMATFSGVPLRPAARSLHRLFRLFIPESSVPPMNGDGSVIPGGEYAVIFAPATHDESPPYLAKLMDCVRDSGYGIAGDGYRAIPIEMGISRREKDYICKIFCPVRRIGL